MTDYLFDSGWCAAKYEGSGHLASGWPANQTLYGSSDQFERSDFEWY